VLASLAGLLAVACYPNPNDLKGKGLAGAPGPGGSTLPAATGCSDGDREAFLDGSSFPAIAGCAANWPESALDAPKSGVACGNSLGECLVPADACDRGWHVCGVPPYGPTDVSAKITADQCAAQSGEFAMAVGDIACAPCSTASGAACCGSLCIQQGGSCVFPSRTAWFGVIDGHVNLCSDIIAAYAHQGVLCCRDGD
jgi:hypothetical protein